MPRFVHYLVTIMTQSIVNLNRMVASGPIIFKYLDFL
ncbi:hypothetical protein FOQG_09071 [Fusarium oxysporum f. sp. raphani 54005]|uniref:Uncharacterized protein n=2 Tax=Fusarium oxysporum TaxID=5507 RepID=X0C0U6_FUSOX|nr:hypothetical protein FOVG_12280 [Fusarium oxysporum f. sp. pisi HDV247]EXK87731.1 hypothetical protein FOQG_09071 [Fusarium oxysporum f. sp. raphani 54005]